MFVIKICSLTGVSYDALNEQGKTNNEHHAKDFNQYFSFDAEFAGFGQ